MVSKYDRLAAWLNDRDADPVTLTFGDIGEIVGAPLPPSARSYREWWGNAKRPPSDAWVNAGWLVRAVDLDAQRVTFARGEHQPRGSAGTRGPGVRALRTPAILNGTEALERMTLAAGWPSLE